MPSFSLLHVFSAVKPEPSARFPKPGKRGLLTTVRTAGSAPPESGDPGVLVGEENGFANRAGRIFPRVFGRPSLAHQLGLNLSKDLDGTADSISQQLRRQAPQNPGSTAREWPRRPKRCLSGLAASRRLGGAIHRRAMRRTSQGGGRAAEACSIRRCWVVM